MKQQLTNLIFLVFPIICFSQDISFKEYSYSEFFELIEQEVDSVFKMENAFVKYNENSDSLFVIKPSSNKDFANSGIRKNPRVIHKELNLKNIHFLTIRTGMNWDTLYGALDNILFEKAVKISNAINVEINNCTFKKRLEIRTGAPKIEAALNQLTVYNRFISLRNSELLESGLIRLMLVNLSPSSNNFYMDVINNRIHFKENIKNRNENEFYVLGRNFYNLNAFKNTFIGKGYVHFRSIEIDQNNFSSNIIKEAVTELFINRPSGWNNVTIENNLFDNHVFWAMDAYLPRYSIPYGQFKDYLSSSKVMYSIIDMDERNSIWWENDTINHALKKNTLKNVIWYKTEVSNKGMLFDFYKSKHDNEDANAVYMQIKDLETDRLEYLYTQNPSFKTYFKWKVNQFLKVFSDYGTEPSKAIVVSVYVILCFALLYLFFPNSWDKHGRKRIMDRYAFFIKYMKKDAGIHEIYLEEKEPELMEYESFKSLVKNSREQVPKFFIATALPLYQWAISGTKLSASFLKHIDIMKGKWQDLAPHQRFLKSTLLICAFLMALIYDLFIKMLNALMLSINTFTTLGFGEIPIKGLPRYLAIIQGFIGWFMLTIFSVSLISQLLN